MQRIRGGRLREWMVTDAELGPREDGGGIVAADGIRDLGVEMYWWVSELA